MFEQARTFRCPNCNEMINDSMKQCPFCSVQVDPAVVSLMAERQEKANRAYNDGSFLKIAAIAMFVFLAVSLVLFLGVIYYGFLVTFVVVLFLLIRWQLTFGSLLTNDADYKIAKRSRNIALHSLACCNPFRISYQTTDWSNHLETSGLVAGTSRGPFQRGSLERFF